VPLGECACSAIHATANMKKSKSNTDKYIGSRLRERRISLNLTQGVVAEALGVSFQQVRNYETGANGLSAVRLFDICEILNVSLTSVFPPNHSRGCPIQQTD
jgi:DNA-binding XRE family transcriptional regulator